MVTGGHGAVIVPSYHAADIVDISRDISRGMVAGAHSAEVFSHHTAAILVAGNVARDSAAGHGAFVLSHHTTDTAFSSRDISRGGAAAHGTKVCSHYAANVEDTRYMYIFQRQVLHLAVGTKTTEQTRIVFFRLIDGQPSDGLAVTVEGTVV